MTTYAGIDYSLGMANVNHETGIHFGVISQNEVLQAWADSSEPVYIHHCPHCGNEIADKFYNKITSECTSEKCPSCKKMLSEEDFYDEEPSGYFLDDGEYLAECGDDGDIFVTKSPYYTYAQYCSPCAPGAGYLMNYYKPSAKDDKKAFDQLVLIKNIAPNAYGDAYKGYAEKAGFPKVYCLGHDWFDDGKAPYPVFDVTTGELVQAPEDKPSNRCPSCNACMINGVYCHEIGCPDAWKDERRECKWCGLTFTPEEKHQKCCCEECSQAYNN